MPIWLVPPAGRKALQDRTADLWTRSVPCSGRFTAVPSKILNCSVPRLVWPHPSQGCLVAGVVRRVDEPGRSRRGRVDRGRCGRCRGGGVPPGSVPAAPGRVYRPAPLRRVMIPKPGRPGEFRPLSIPTVADRVVMTAAKLVLEPVFEADFLPVSYGFRPKRSAIDACEGVRVEANRGREWVLEADIRDCFGSIGHDALMAQVARRVCDGAMLRLIRSWLRVGVLEEGDIRAADGRNPTGLTNFTVARQYCLARLGRGMAA